MKNYLYEDYESGERFFVQCDTPEEAVEIILDNGFNLPDIEFLGEFTDAEAEWYGYDTY